MKKVDSDEKYEKFWKNVTIIKAWWMSHAARMDVQKGVEIEEMENVYKNVREIIIGRSQEA